MNKYSYKNIIIDPTKEGIESLIGKEVYFHNNPSLCLENANEKSTSNLGILVEIFKNSIVPFRIEQKCGTCTHTCASACIIEKKEEPKKYVPFENADEFINAYDSANYSVKNRTVENKLLNYGGMWLKHRESDDFFMVLEIRDDGVVIRRNLFTTSWNDLSNDYTFLDGSPCGKLMEE